MTLHPADIGIIAIYFVSMIGILCSPNPGVVEIPDSCLISRFCPNPIPTFVPPFLNHHV